MCVCTCQYCMSFCTHVLYQYVSHPDIPIPIHVCTLFFAAAGETTAAFTPTDQRARTPSTDTLSGHGRGDESLQMSGRRHSTLALVRMMFQQQQLPCQVLHSCASIRSGPAVPVLPTRTQSLTLCVWIGWKVSPECALRDGMGWDGTNMRLFLAVAFVVWLVVCG